MRIYRVELRHFRGFRATTLTPSGHVVLVGEPGAGRSDLIEGLDRVLSPDATRVRFATELDFYKRDTSKRGEVEVTFGELSEELEQEFFDHLELWDRETKEVVDELADPETIDRDNYDLVVRLCYRVAWVKDEDQAEHWVDYPKTSDPDAGIIDRVGRAERASLPFAILQRRIQALDLSNRGNFRRLAESAAGDDFAEALSNLESEIEKLAGQFSDTKQVSAALEGVLASLRTPLRLADTAAAHIFRFLPEGGSLSGLIKSLAPAVDLQDGCGPLPLYRHGSTLTAMLEVAQALATVAGKKGVIAVDDFGEGLDGASTEHFAAVLRRSASQLWLSTRRADAAEAFAPHELVRLARDRDGNRLAYHGRLPRTKAERLAERHRRLQLLPAMTSRAVIVLEGPHDRAALTALATRLHEQENVLLPAASCVSLVDAGAVDASGGTSGIIRLASAAKELGLRTVAVIDYDSGGNEDPEETLKKALDCADAVVRLPKGYAVELALLDGLDDQCIKGALSDLSHAFGVFLPPTLDALSGTALYKAARKVIKQSAGLHAQFVEALPPGYHPPSARRILETAIQAAVGEKTGYIQL